MRPIFNNFLPRLAKKYTLFQGFSPFKDSKKLVTITNDFITSKFSYRPLIWMFHSRKFDHKTDTINERAFRLTYKDSVSTFEQLMAKQDLKPPMKGI